MRVLGYGQWDGEFLSGLDGVIDVYHDVGHAAGHARDADEIVALVPVADLDVEQAVERAARGHFDRVRSEALAHGDHTWPPWNEVPADDQAGWRDHVRPIVLAALGETP